MGTPLRLTLIAVIGFVVCLIMTYVPMPEPFRKTVTVIVVPVPLVRMVRA